MMTWGPACVAGCSLVFHSSLSLSLSHSLSVFASRCVEYNDLTRGWQNLNLLSHPINATLAPQARQAKASGENLKYMTLAPQARRLSGEILNYSLSHFSDILSMIIGCVEYVINKCIIFYSIVIRK